MQNKFINEAILLSRDSIDNHNGGPFGAVVVKDNQIIGRGINQVTEHNDPTAHAEIEAIRDACQKIKSFSLKGCTLYSSSEPCPMCLSAIYWARIDTVYFANTYEQACQIGFDDQLISRELNLPHSEKQISISQIKEPSSLKQAHDVFLAWGSKQSKQNY